MIRLACVIIIAAGLSATLVDPVTPLPYTATYAGSYRGFNVGRLHCTLRAEGGGRFVFESRADPIWLARIFIGSEAVERSVMLIDADGVRPLSWFVEDGKRGHKEDGTLEFDWDKQRVSGIVGDEQVEAPTEPGLQDRLSLQVAVMTALLRAREPGTIPMIDNDKIKHYRFVRIGSGRIETQAGEFETVRYEGAPPGSSRRMRSWHAPALGYIPVRIEQLRKGRVETVMELVEVARGED